MLVWSIEMGQSLTEVEKVFVSTDDAEIEEVAKDFGAEVLQRPSNLAQDESPEWLAWQQAIQIVQDKYGIFDLFLSLPTTAPLRTQEDVRKCLALLDENTDVVITLTPASRIPWFNMVSTDDSGNLRFSSKVIITVVRMDKVYDVTTWHMYCDQVSF